MEIQFLKNINSLIGDTIFEKWKIHIYEIQKKIFFSMLYMEDNQGKFQDGKKNKKIVYSNMIYNKYMTEHVEPNKYFYVRRGIIQKKSQCCKVEDCFKISSYGFCNRMFGS